MGSQPVKTATVQQLRQILLWPLRLTTYPLSAAALTPPWQLIQTLPGSPWRAVEDEYTGDPRQFQERHYNEFVSFLPYVQRFLYGEGRSQRVLAEQEGLDGGSPMRVLRRTDVASVRVIAHEGDASLLLDIVHIDLYFFYDVDLVFLNLEVAANNISLPTAQELLYRFGRAFPGGWSDDGAPLHGMYSVQWLDAQGNVLAESDSQDREAFLAEVCEHRAPRFANHWSWLLEPMVSHHSSAPGLLRYSQIEYYRMPVMAYLALDDPTRLSRSDFVRLGLVTGAAESAEECDTAGAGAAGQWSISDEALPFAAQHLADFEQRYCLDRFWKPGGAAPETRYLCCGYAMVVVGRADSAFFTCTERGVLAQFRHQHFLLFLIAHFQKATLLMFSDRLVEALRRLNVHNPESVRVFKRSIRGNFESFLRFTHRYWFHEISAQVQMRALSHLCSSHLGLNPLYDTVRQRVSDMNTYLDTDSQRRQANTVVRLTVVTIFGLIGTLATGFLGMNLIALTEEPFVVKTAYFMAVMVLFGVLVAVTMAKSKKLSNWLDVLSDKHSSWHAVWRSFLGVFWR
jgi:CorA-like Mg2+ transporter protein